jgi:hypothetical protein
MLCIRLNILTEFHKVCLRGTYWIKSHNTAKHFLFRIWFTAFRLNVVLKENKTATEKDA